MHDMPLITTMAAAFSAAWVLGLIAQRLKLAPIVGYLLAGVAIGPHTPGFTADVELAAQLAELGVILLMFGVGLHFHVKDLLAVGRVAIPGAVGQSLAATLLGGMVAYAMGWPIKSGLVFGMALAVASTVVLIRVLTDRNKLDSPAGHVAVGWLIVEDIFTVVLLVLIPALAVASSPQAQGDASEVAGVSMMMLGKSLLIAMFKLAALVAVLLVVVAKIVPWIMVQVARLRSRELFTLTVLVMAIAIASGSAYGFGVSMALGAFLAGMVVGQSPVSQQAGADALPFRDAFTVLFFTSVGMLFDPRSLWQNPGLLFAGLGIVLIGKPLAALLIVGALGRPAQTALIVAAGLSQVGEFSFILADLARKHGLMENAAYNVVIACAMVTITLNPLLFRALAPTEKVLRRVPSLWGWLNRSERHEGLMNQPAHEAIEQSLQPVAVVLGYGPVGKTIDKLLRETGFQTIVVDLNMDTVQSLTREGRPAIFGNAYNIEVMAHALPSATHLIITLPHAANRGPLIVAAKLINPSIKVFVRAHYISEREDLAQVGADAACFEEAEVAVALARLTMSDRGADSQAIRQKTADIRVALDTNPQLGDQNPRTPSA